MLTLSVLFTSSLRFINNLDQKSLGLVSMQLESRGVRDGSSSVVSTGNMGIFSEFSVLIALS